jgi:hypothetical protein
MASLNTVTFWILTLCSILVGYRRFGGTLFIFRVEVGIKR